MADESLCLDFDICVTLYKYFVKQSSADDRQLLGIVASVTNNASGNNSDMFSPKDRYYDSNEWYTLSNSDKGKVSKARSGINTG